MSPDKLHSDHSRLFSSNRFVYPVLSRRAGGISLGINLNPDKVCNFDCIYCQVNRTQQSEVLFVDTPHLLDELRQTLQHIVSGKIFETSQFCNTPAPQQRLTDLAFSGDGEPTTYRNFDQIIAACADIKRQHELGQVKMVLITNASMLHREHVQRGLEILDANQGEIWAKLEAGTDAYYRLVERTPIRFAQILKNIAAAAQRRPIIIQSLFMRIRDAPPSLIEQQEFCDRLNEITGAGGHISLIQIYTIARPPAESYVTPLSNEEVDALVELVRQQTGLTATGFYGVWNE